MINGVVTDFVHIDDRAIHYGDGIFETILCSDSKIYFWKQHYQRLHDSASKLNIRCPDEKLFLDEIHQLFCNENISIKKDSVIKIILSRGAGERGYDYSDKIISNRFISLTVLDTEYSSLLSGKLLTGDLYLCKNQVSINESLAGIKHLNRLENVLARNEWANIINKKIDKNIIDGLMLNADQQAIECTMSNVFAVKDKQLFTPELSQSGVRGIMRDKVINLATECDVPMSECTITVDELMLMDELFISNSLIGIKSVNSLGDKQFSQSQITKNIFEKLLDKKEEHAQKL
jgi:4-amino-4-deoxychorismate lyase